MIVRCVRSVLVLVCLTSFGASLARGELTKISESKVVDSEEPWARRIYFYDLGVDSSDRAHVIYMKPVSDTLGTVVYAVENGASWSETTLTSQGKVVSDGVAMGVDGSDTVHLCYIVGEADPNIYLAYRTVSASGQIAEETVVDEGGWRSRMQVTPAGEVYFVREYYNGFNLLVPNGSGGWRWETVTVPDVDQVRLANFHMDATKGCHITYGDGAATFGEGLNHNLWYAASSTPTGGAWTAETVTSASGNPLYDGEFWVDLTTDTGGTPYTVQYSYTHNTNNSETSCLFSSRASGSWVNTTATAKQPGARAGMGPGLAIDARGFHGVWDSSPDVPYEFDSSRGNIAYRFSADGTDWTVHQLLAPYSAEGRCEVQIKNGRLHVLVLGDYTDTWIYHLRYDLPEEDLFEVYPDHMVFHDGDAIPLRARIRGDFTGDWYVALTDSQGTLYNLTSAMTWEVRGSPGALTPVLAGASGFAFNGEVMRLPTGTPPLTVKPDLMLYSAVVESGTALAEGRWVTPVFGRLIHYW